MALGADPSAANGQYVYATVSDQGWDGKGKPPPTGAADQQVTVPADGKYVVWVHMWYSDANGNSVWLVVDGGQGIRVGNEENDYRRWKWVNWQDGAPSSHISMQLTAGQHDVQLIGRESGTRVDQVLLTQDANYVPK
jgi:hypothetical protein